MSGKADQAAHELERLILLQGKVTDATSDGTVCRSSGAGLHDVVRLNHRIGRCYRFAIEQSDAQLRDKLLAYAQQLEAEFAQAQRQWKAAVETELGCLPNHGTIA